jgi:dipeptidyl-peptidase-4
MTFRAAILPAALLSLCASPGAAGPLEPLTVNEIVAPQPVTGNAPGDFTWSPDGSHYAYSVAGRGEGAPPVLSLHDMRTGRERRLRGADSSVRGSRSRPLAQIVWSPDATRIAFIDGGALDVARADGTRVRVLASDADDPQWSPDGSKLAYVHENDLYTIALATRRVTRLTRATAATRINGDPDWLYSEELDLAHAYAWSPDGDAIAYLSFDESPVTDFPIEAFLHVPDNAVEHQRYPLAGEANPRVSLHVVHADGSGERLLYDGAPHDEYLVAFAWTPDGTHVVDEILDRPQRHLRLASFARAGGAARTILTESDRRFVNVSPAPRFIAGGTAFLWISERDGVAAVYRVVTATGAARRLTGTMPVAGLAQVDESAGRAYVEALYPTRREHALVAVALNGGAAPVAITPERGSHAVAMPERGTGFIDVYSTAQTPPVVLRRDARTGASATLFRTPSLARFALGTTSLAEIPSPYGDLDAKLVVPPDFDPTKPYPVIVNVYGGPLPVSAGAGAADDRWGGLYPHLLAERGFVSLYVSGPPERNDRTENVRSYSGHMGEVAIRGPIAAVDWLRKQTFADPKRIGLFGWSYGGYLTAYTLTHAPELFASGIAGAPPVDWRFYDTAYTERYLGTPEREKAAYDRTAVLPAAARLRANLLILQGSSDDNVHLENSMTLLDAFIRAGKQVEYFAFPGERHGPHGSAAMRYLDTKMLDWWERTLR